MLIDERINDIIAANPTPAGLDRDAFTTLVHKLPRAKLAAAQKEFFAIQAIEEVLGAA